MQELINKYDKQIYLNLDNHSQFLIDFMEELEDNYSDLEVGAEETFKEAVIYKIETILEVIKESEDKNLLYNLKQELEKCEI